ncbi:MAG: serine peptidase [Gammaproteobacteria bacterium]|jgi:serine protease Do|nr:serine peptidase [Gammaproteobacteria bacterium]|tara:strand:- start:2433 stop:3842 length:1410 start_codon:yes stop_codon:yes gene_type:complete
MKKLFSPLAIVLLSLILTPTKIFSADSLPNFTEVVEKNIPSVVIVNAKKNIGQNNNPRLNIPNVPDEFKPFLDKFFNGMPTPPPGSQSRKTPSFGSGFILSADGYIMTNNHVISNADEITIRLSDDTVLDAKLIGQDERSDLALLKVEANNLPTVSIGDSNNLKLGEWVLAIGSPFGFDHTVTAGIVSGKKRNLPNESYVPYIQTDVAINPGNSGGPLFNLQGEVVGVNAQIYTRSGGFMGVSFAIPAETLSNVYRQLKDDGKVKRGWLGVFIQQVDKDLAESFGLDKAKGAVVARILENSPAEKAGLKQGDIILKFDNKEIKKSKDLPLMVGSTNVNETVKIELLRDKRVITKFIKIEELPDDDMIASMKENTIDKTIVSGLTVSDINESMKKNLNIYGGVKVDKISADQLNNSKIKVNDIITHINNKPIYNTNDFKKEINGLSKNTLANLLVYRDNAPLFLAIKISK